MRELQAKECRWPLEAEKASKIPFPLKYLKETKVCQHLDFSPVKLIVSGRPPEL